MRQMDTGWKITRGTPKSLEQAIEDGFELMALALKNGCEVDRDVIAKCVRDYLAQGMTVEMFRTQNEETLQALTNLSVRWNMKKE